LKINL